MPSCFTNIWYHTFNLYGNPRLISAFLVIFCKCSICLLLYEGLPPLGGRILLSLKKLLIQKDSQPNKSGICNRQNFPGGSDGKEPTCNAGRPRFNPWVKIHPLNGNPLQYSYLENSMNRGAWQAPLGRKGLDTTERLIYSLGEGFVQLQLSFILTLLNQHLI